VFAQELGKQNVDVLNLRGGILAWLHAGGRVYRQGRAVKQVHVYGERWDLAPADFQTVK